MSTYEVTYKAPRDADDALLDTVDYLNDHAGDETVADASRHCAVYGIIADLRDAAGFRKGYVHSDGSYTLK
jgi:hypothetical protein